MGQGPLIRHKALVKNGELYLKNMQLYKDHLKEMEGKVVSIVIEDYFEDPSFNQYKFLNGVIVKEALKNEQYGGWTGDDFLKEMKRIYPIKDPITPEVSLSDVSKKKLSEFIDSVINHLGAEGIEIQEPSKYKY